MNGETTMAIKGGRPIQGARTLAQLDRATQRNTQTTPPKGIKHPGPGGHFVNYVTRKA
jgi:hypothetical protein